MPSPAASCAHTAIIHCRRQAAQVANARRSQRLDYRQDVGCKSGGLLDLNFTAERRRISRVASIPESVRRQRL